MTADRGRRSLLGAADSYPAVGGAENRLTEILAEVLRTSPSLAAWLVFKAFEPDGDWKLEDAERCCAFGDYTVDAQCYLPGGGRPDMAIRFHGVKPLRKIDHLYCENKINAGWTWRQQEGYEEVGNARFLTLTLDGEGPKNLPDQLDGKFVNLSWRDLAHAAYDVGVRLGSEEAANGTVETWRTAAMRPDALGESRLLAELLYELGKGDIQVTIPDPLSPNDLDLLPEMNAVRARWKELRELVLDELRGNEACGDAPFGEQDWLDRRWDPDELGNERLAFLATLHDGPSWDGTGWPALKRLSTQPPDHSWQQLVVSPKVERMGEGRDRPFVGIGVALAKFGGWDLHDERWQRLQARIEDLGEEVWHGWTFGSRRYEILLTKPLDEFPHEATLDRQAEQITRWALKRREVLLAIDAN